MKMNQNLTDDEEREITKLKFTKADRMIQRVNTITEREYTN